MGILKNTIANLCLEAESDQELAVSLSTTFKINPNAFSNMENLDLNEKTPNELLKDIMLKVNILQEVLFSGEKFVDPENIAQINFLKNKNKELKEELIQLRGN